MKNRNGFTLVELVVAIAILGVITLIALPTIKSIQANNNNAKYIAYEKSLKSASKAYTDAFDEDLFGATNTGCAIIKYSDLKEKDLISDIQIKGIKCDKDEDTFVFVMKAENDNHAYFSSIKCYDSKEVVYSNKEDDRSECKLEDGKGPEAALTITPDQKKYYLGDKPKGTLTITDTGIGLKANQELDYEWFKDGVSTGKKKAKFENKAYKSKAFKDIEMPNEDEITKPTNFRLKVTGTVYDVNNNATEVNIEKSFKYYLHPVIITYLRNTSSTDTTKTEETKDEEQDYTIANNTWTNSNKVFLGWATDSSATGTKGTWYDPTDIYKTNESLNLYAQWFDIDSLENAYTTYVQSDDFLQQQVTNSYNSGTAGSVFNSSYTIPSVPGYVEKDVSGFACSTHYRPYRINKSSIDVRTLTAPSGSSPAYTSLHYLYLRSRQATTYPNDTIETRIDRLQKINDVAISRNEIIEDTNCYVDNEKIAANGDKEVKCNPPQNYKYIALSGFLLSNATARGWNASRKYIDSAYINGSGQGVVHATYSYANRTSKLQIRGYFAAVPNKKARTTTYTSTKPYGKARYIALSDLQNNGHANKYFPESYMKVSEVNVASISGGTWLDYSKISRNLTAPNNGVILGTSRVKAVNSASGSGDDHVVLADLYMPNHTFASTNSFFVEYRGGNLKRNQVSGNGFTAVDAIVGIRYISSGTLQ